MTTASVAGTTGEDRSDYTREESRAIRRRSLRLLGSLVSPLRSDREIARELHDAADLDFVEVHVATPVSECERRDPKGLYRRAREGTLRGLTGVDAPYEKPENPDLRFDTTGADINDLAQRIVGALTERGVLDGG